MNKTNLAFVLLAAPVAAFAFETVDTLPRPTEFPAYSDTADTARPTELFLQAGMMRDSNILRLQTGAQGATVFRVGGGVRHTTRLVGRQSVRLEARGDFYEYDKFGALDHFAYGLLGEWLWEVGNQLSGTLGASRTQRNIDIGEAQRAVRDLVTETRYYGTAGYLVTPSLRLRGGLDVANADRGGRADAEVDRTGVTVGADYVSPLGNAVGIEARRTSGAAPVPEFIAPVGTFVDNDFRETEVALVGAYSVGTTLRATGRVGRTKRDYSQIPGRDFDGTTGRLALDWLAGAKTRLSFAGYREPRSILDIAASHVLVKGVSFGASWAATAKTVLSARWLREERAFQGDPAIVLAPGTAQRDETIRIWRFGLGWEPQRHWELGFAFDHGERSSNIAGRSYDYNAVVANVRYRY